MAPNLHGRRVDHQSLSFILILISGLGIGAQWLAWALRLPAIVVLSVAGVVAGPVLGLIQPSDDFGALLRPAVGVAVALILFDGGMNLRLHEFRETAPGVKRLVTVGVVLSWFFGAAAAHYVGGLPWPVALLFGAILVVTGPTVIVPLLRQAKLARRPASFLKWEGIINDPIGAILAVLVFEFFALSGIGMEAEEGAAALLEVVFLLGLVVVTAVALGTGIGFGLQAAFKRGWVPEFLKVPVVLAAALLVFGLNNLVLPESGLLTTTILGVVLGNARDVGGMESVRRFNEYLTLILVSGVFILLTANLDPAIATELDWRGAALLAVILLAVRPAAVWLATIGADMSWRERALVGWIAPRGIVAAAIAGFFGPQMAALGFAGAEMLMPLVFAVIFLTMIAHGFTLSALARRLGLAAGTGEGILLVGATVWTSRLARKLEEVGLPVLLADANRHSLREPAAAGIAVYRGDILSGASEEDVDLYEIGYVFAATDNDAYNALVCTQFAPTLGHERVFQLAMHEVDTDDPEAPRRDVHGRIAMGEWAYHEELLSRCHRGWRFETLRFDDRYEAEGRDWEHQDDAAPVLVLRENRTVVFNAVGENPLRPEEGDVMVAFVAPGWRGPARHQISGACHRSTSIENRAATPITTWRRLMLRLTPRGRRTSSSITRFNSHEDRPDSASL